jgi:hypothetical protein
VAAVAPSLRAGSGWLGTFPDPRQDAPLQQRPPETIGQLVFRQGKQPGIQTAQFSHRFAMLPEFYKYILQHIFRQLPGFRKSQCIEENLVAIQIVQLPERIPISFSQQLKQLSFLYGPVDTHTAGFGFTKIKQKTIPCIAQRNRMRKNGDLRRFGITFRN